MGKKGRSVEEELADARDRFAMTRENLSSKIHSLETSLMQSELECKSVSMRLNLKKSENIDKTEKIEKLELNLKKSELKNDSKIFELNELKMDLNGFKEKWKGEIQKRIEFENKLNELNLKFIEMNGESTLIQEGLERECLEMNLKLDRKDDEISRLKKELIDTYVHDKESCEISRSSIFLNEEEVLLRRIRISLLVLFFF